ncbi:monovalent cation/H(+) antiporter subunit G [Baekduia soli]|uniref:Monovalent cation/H(+) antiporter subunit G n=1 Tax=Baekduia soli TaxID=496014 RepID=A0A5B8U5L8_9ACTN|nr:monovalent cation/H(+) antiporter subunit G [Baekduia soli]QEC48231.1 monovalent cation/H(+) antiporter subunit G [Baekduia soli]
MSLRDLVVDALLIATVALTVISVAGVLLMRDVLDRLHYAGPALLGALCAASAVLVAGGPSLIATRAILLATILLVTAPVLTHATARAIHDRRAER